MPDLPRDPRSIHVGTRSAPTRPAGTRPGSRPARRRSRASSPRSWLWLLVVLASLIAVPLLGMGLSAWNTWRGVERVDVSALLRTDGGAATNYLVVGTDSRDGVDDDVENAGVIFGDGVGGERTDTIAIMRVADGEVALLAIPRDLYVAIEGHGTNRINAAFAFGGPELLITTIQQNLGIPIDHYVEVDFAGFLGLVDALGGVTVDFAHPAYDERSGLAIDTAGPVELSSADALAYVRSRRYSELIDGQLVTDPTSDLGRVQRQQRFLGAVMAELGATRNPFVLLGALDAVASNVRVDAGFGLSTASRLGLTLRGAEPTTATVPTTRFITPNGADVLVLVAESDRVLADFRS